MQVFFPAFDLPFSFFLADAVVFLDLAYQPITLAG